MSMSSPRILRFSRSVEPSAFGTMSSWMVAARPIGLVQPKPLKRSCASVRSACMLMAVGAPSPTPALGARRRIQVSRPPNGRLALVRRTEDALPGKLGRDAPDADLALGFDGLFGEVHIERAARHVDIAEKVRGNGVVKPRRTPNLDLIELEIGQQRHGEREAALCRTAQEVGLQADTLDIAERLMIEQLKHGWGGAGRRERDLAPLGVLAEIGNEKAALAKRDLLPRRYGDLALRNIDGELHPGHGQLGLAGEDRRHSGNVGDAHAGNIELDTHRFGRKLLPRFDFGEFARAEVHRKLAAQDLSAADPLQGPAARLAGKEFRPKPLQDVERHRADLAGQMNFFRARGIDEATGKLNRGVAGANGEARDRHAPLLRHKAPRDLPFIDLHGRKPKLLDRKIRLVGIEGTVP